MGNDLTRNGAHVALAAARGAVNEPGRASALLLRHGTMSLRWYAPRGEDAQTPHVQDEIYVVATGTGRFVCGTAVHEFGPGDVLFAAAHSEHRFIDFTDDLGLWVLFWGPPGGEGA